MAKKQRRKPTQAPQTPPDALEALRAILIPDLDGEADCVDDSDLWDELSSSEL